MRTFRRPLTRWYLGAGLLLVGLGGALVRGVLDHEELQNGLDAMPRTTVPGVVTVAVPSLQGLIVYCEDPSADGGFVGQASDTNRLPVSPVDLAVTGRSGDRIATAYCATDLRFDVGDRIATALASFEAPSAGEYTIAVVGDDVPPEARMSVGVAVLRFRTSPDDVPALPRMYA